MATELKFDSITAKQVPVHIGDKTYTLTAPSSASANKFREALSRCSRVVNGQAVIRDAAGMVTANMELVSRSLKDPDGKNVPAKEFQDWPSEIVEAVLRETIDLCGFPKGEGEDDDLKN